MTLAVGAPSNNSDELDLVISIGSLGNHEVLARCLTTLFEEDDPGFRFEVWVVFNGHDERPVVDLLRQQFPSVRLFISRGGPLGYCRTQNFTLERARSRYVLLLDDDTLVPKGTLPGMVRFMDEHTDVGMSGCETHNADGSYQ
ncbi:MAG: GT2 family glycosyltransferase, partial [Gammaproteobacteria bacterium]